MKSKIFEIFQILNHAILPPFTKSTCVCFDRFKQFQKSPLFLKNLKIRETVEVILFILLTKESKFNNQ